MLDNPRSPRVRAVAKLTKRSARQETGLFLLEGPQAAREALAYRPDTVVEVYATPTAMERHPDVRDAVREAGLEVEYTTEAALDAMADTVTPQGIVAVARQSPSSLKDVFADPHVQARNMTLEMAHGSGATVKVIANPVKLSATPPTYRSAPPVLGEHTDSVLSGILGMSAADIAELRAKGVL